MIYFTNGVENFRFSLFSLIAVFRPEGLKTQLENDILKRQIEIKAWNRCQETRLGVLEDCSVTGSDFFDKWRRKFSIFTVFPYSCLSA